MGQEQIKVLEMVAAGKISPDEGERLLNALNSGNRGRHSSRGFEVGDIRVPNVDVGRLAEMAVDLKKSVLRTARTAQGQIKKSKAGRYLEPKDYPIAVDQSAGPDLPVSLDFNIQAGQLKLLGDMDESGKLMVGRATCVPDAPSIVSELQEGRQRVSLRHSLGTCWLRLADAPVYKVKLDNAAADTRLEFATLRLASLKVNNNAGNLDIRIGDRLPHVEVEIVNNAGSVELALDGGYALKIHSSGTLSSSNIENLGLSLVDGSYVSPDWKENPRGVEILLAQNVASFSISWRGARKAARLVQGSSESGSSLPQEQEPLDEERMQQQLSEADVLAAEASAAVSQVQADIERLSQAAPAGAGAKPQTPGASAASSTAPGSPAGADLPSSDL